MHKVMLTNQNKKAVKKEPDRIFRGRLFGNRIAPFSKQCSYCWPGSGPAFDLICVGDSGCKVWLGRSESGNSWRFLCELEHIRSLRAPVRAFQMASLMQLCPMTSGTAGHYRRNTALPSYEHQIWSFI